MAAVNFHFGIWDRELDKSMETDEINNQECPAKQYICIITETITHVAF